MLASTETHLSRTTSSAADNRRQDILEAAIELIDERGYTGATSDQIAERAGISKRTLYNYMGSKQHILSEIHRNFIEEGLQRWVGVISEGGDPEVQLRKLISEHARTVIDFRRAIRVFFEEMKHLSPPDRSEIVAQRDAYQEILMNVLERGVADGSFRSFDPRIVGLLVLGSLNESYRWYDDATSATVLVEFLAEFVVRGLRARA